MLRTRTAAAAGSSILLLLALAGCANSDTPEAAGRTSSATATPGATNDPVAVAPPGDAETTPANVAEVPADCVAGDYGSNGAPITRPECAFVRVEMDLSDGQAMTSKTTLTTAVASLTSSGDLGSAETNTPAKWVAARNKQIDSQLAGTVQGTDLVVGDVLSAKDFTTSLEGHAVVMRNAGVFTSDYAAENYSYSVSGTIATLDWTLDGGMGVVTGELVIRFPWAVTESNGTIDGDTVTWPVASSSMHMYAVAKG